MPRYPAQEQIFSVGRPVVDEERRRKVKARRVVVVSALCSLQCVDAVISVQFSSVL